MFIIFFAHPFLSQIFLLGSFSSLLSSSFRTFFSENLTAGINSFYLSENIYFALILLNLYFHCEIYMQRVNRVKENNKKNTPVRTS